MAPIKTELWNLKKVRSRGKLPVMTDKEIVQDLLQRIPDNASLQEIALELEFIAGIREGLADLDSGQTFPIEEVEQEFPSWIIK